MNWYRYYGFIFLAFGIADWKPTTWWALLSLVVGCILLARDEAWETKKP
jgi:hypothetical protein